MLKIYNYKNDAELLPLVLNDEKWYITHKYNGFDTLTFEIDSTDKMYENVAEEVKVIANNNKYVIKKIDEHSTFATVNCVIDLDDWKRSLFTNFRKTDILLSDVFDIIKPSGWVIKNAALITLHTTVEESENNAFEYVTSYDMLATLENAYNCVFNFNTIKKELTVLTPDKNVASGDFFSDELNLKSIGYVGNSENFATRLYAYGKKDETTGERLTFKDINNGKEYVENNTYSNKLICVGWSDERYTVKENLLADAKKKLAEMAIPARSYTCDAYKLDDGIWTYKIVTLIDRKRKTRIEHQIVEFKEYPNARYLNSITLSAVTQTVKGTVNSVKDTVKKEIKKNNDYMQNVLDEAIKKATDSITKNKGGAFYLIYDADGKLQEIVNLGDTEDINTAKQVWRWNASGLGHSNSGYNGTYDLALLADGSINANMITTGELNANLIKTGVLEVKDNDGNTLFSVNMSTGATVINNGIFRVAETYQAAFSLGSWSAKTTVKDSTKIYKSFVESVKESEVHGILTKRYGVDGLQLTAVHATGDKAYPESGTDGAYNARYIISSRQDNMVRMNLVIFGWNYDNETDEAQDWKKNCIKCVQPLWINNRLYTTNSIVFSDNVNDTKCLYGYTAKSGKTWIESKSSFKIKEQMQIVGALEVGLSGDTTDLLDGKTNIANTIYNHGTMSTENLQVRRELHSDAGEITSFTCRTLSVTSGKSRIVNTNNYNVREQYCYEMATPYFGDIGGGRIDEKGECIILIDDIFSETVLLDKEYYVFLQKENDGDCYIADKKRNYFVVRGTPGLKFAWELKAKQKGLDNNDMRLELSAQAKSYGEENILSIFENEKEKINVSTEQNEKEMVNETERYINEQFNKLYGVKSQRHG